MSDLRRTTRLRAPTALALAGSLMAGAWTSNPAAAAGSEGANPENTYQWSARLVEFDVSDRVATLEAPFELHADRSGLENVDAGERVLLTWTGITTAAGVRAVTSGNEAGFDRFTMPVDFVATTTDGRYLQFRVPVPAGRATVLSAVGEDQWVTATTSHDSTDWRNVVLDIRAYNDVG